MIERSETMNFGFGRRDFLKGCAAAFGLALIPPLAASAEESGKPPAGGRLIASAPVLQNAAATSIGVAFAVGGLASGWVEISRSADMSHSRKVFSGDDGLMAVDGKVALVRIRGLKPSTRYWYRIGADRIRFERYRPFNDGSEIDSQIHSFTTLGANARGTFCVVADSHEREPAWGMMLAKLKELKPAVVVWDGDATANFNMTIDDAIKTFIRVHPDFPEYAANTPWMFVPGNHDFRGLFNRHLHDLMMLREPSERDSRYAALGRNFVQRFGEVAFIGLDTGEDKPDAHPYFGGVAKFEPYRRLQTHWLAEALESRAVKTARFKIAFCHIPLFDPRPDVNAGDVVEEIKAAEWHRPCAEMWGSLFEKSGVQLVVTGHQHRFRYDPPAQGRSWAHIVCGGCDIRGDAKFPTVLEGCVENGTLHIKVHNVASGKTVLALKI